MALSLGTLHYLASLRRPGKPFAVGWKNVGVAQTGRPRKPPATPGDLIRTLAVILIPLLVITFFFTRNLDDAPVTVIDYRSLLAKARQEAPYPVLAPTGLPTSWRATQAVWVPKGDPYLNGEPSARNLWELGFLSPEDVFIAVNQGDLQPGDFIDDKTREGTPDGTSEVNGQRWERRVSPDERTRSLVLASPKVTTIVVGDVSYEGLEAFASTLNPG